MIDSYDPKVALSGQHSPQSRSPRQSPNRSILKKSSFREHMQQTQHSLVSNRGEFEAMMRTMNHSRETNANHHNHNDLDRMIRSTLQSNAMNSNNNSGKAIYERMSANIRSNTFGYNSPTASINFQDSR